MTNDEMITLLRAAIKKSGKSQRQWAIKHGIEPVRLNDILHERAPMSAAVAKALGYKRGWTKIK